MNKKIFEQVRVQLKEIIKISNVLNKGLSDRLQLKMKTNAFKRSRQVIKIMEKNDLSSDWLEENFGVSVGDLKHLLEEL